MLTVLASLAALWGVLVLLSLSVRPFINRLWRAFNPINFVKVSLGLLSGILGTSYLLWGL